MEPLVRPSTIKASEVKRRTGFSSVLDLITYVITICNGDLELVRRRDSSMSWFEEWFMFFEISYGHTTVRQVDIEAVWDMKHDKINKIKDNKVGIEVSALQSWPAYATLREDKLLRKKGKWDHYGEDERLVFWDMTNIEAPTFENSVGQRQTYSDYYGMCCFKGGVGLQPCGLIVNEDLWVGGVSDTEYNKRSGYLQKQKDFQERDLYYEEGDLEGKLITWLIIYDRGYRAKMAAWLEGKQRVLQPPASKSDERFKERMTVYAATIAHDRSGNERAVNVCKRSGVMKRAFKPNMNPIRFNYAWRGWAF